MLEGAGCSHLPSSACGSVGCCDASLAWGDVIPFPVSPGAHISIVPLPLQSSLYWSTGTALEWWLKCIFLSLNTMMEWQRSCLNESISFPQGQRVQGGSNPHSEGRNAALGWNTVCPDSPISRTCPSQEPMVLSFSKQPSAVTCHNPAEPAGAVGRGLPNSEAHCFKLLAAANNPCHWGVTWCLQMLSFLPGLIF